MYVTLLKAARAELEAGNLDIDWQSVTYSK